MLSVVIRGLKLDVERTKIVTSGVEGLASWVLGEIRELRVVLEFSDGDCELWEVLI